MPRGRKKKELEVLEEQTAPLIDVIAKHEEKKKRGMNAAFLEQQKKPKIFKNIFVKRKV